MTDDGPAEVANLPGDPASWPATVRDLLRYVRAESPAPEELDAWWLETVEGVADPDAAERDADRDADAGAAADRDADAELAGGDSAGGVERRLAFLEAAGVVDRTGETATPGRYGREYLDSHDEAVVYEGLASALDGLEAVLRALAIRPLTDVEIADLLAAERGVETVADETARTHRRWLAAIGFLEHDDGVNELTRRGRRMVDAAGGPAPPGAAATPDAVSSADGYADADPPAGGDGEPAVDDRGEARAAGGEPATAAVERTTAYGERTALGDEAGPGRREPVAGAGSSGDDAAGRGADRPYVRELKSLYDDACAICGDRRRGPGGEGFSRVHHLMPPGDPHGGPEIPENAVVVCPNHLADLRNGTVTVDPRTLEIEHAYEPDLTGRTLATADGHEPGAQYLAYHAAVIADRSE